MHICHIQSLFSAEHGGPTQSLTNYAIGQSARGHAVSLRVLEGFSGASPARHLNNGIDQKIFQLNWPERLGWSLALNRSLKTDLIPDAYHLHGSWHLAMVAGARAARSVQRPYIVELMGSFSEYELARKPVRKAIARRVFQDRVLREAACLHVNSRQEGECLRDLGFTTPIAVVPVGVDIGRLEQTRCHAPSLWPKEGAERCILFLSRVHPTKGIDLLLRAWAQVQALLPGWRLVVAGTGEGGYLQTCRSLVESSGIAKTCRFLGHLTDEEKAWAFRRAAFYVLPSRQENFGNTVAEALALGTPALSTTATPWGNWLPGSCGWICQPTVEDLADALHRAASTTETDRRDMGMRGAKLVAREMSVERVLNDLDAIYSWVSGGRRPEGILL